MQGRTIEESCFDTAFVLNTDLMLVSRTLGNMLLNALEATPDGGRVLLETRREDDAVCWAVSNSGHIPENIQKRIFQRHFSTKEGSGRGFGTYSMKLFAEHYLNGSITFASSAETGTVFTLRLPVA